MQLTVFIVWAAVSLIVVATFVAAYLRSRGRISSAPYSVVTKRRFQFFFALVLGLMVLFFVAMSRAPYPTRGSADEVIDVKARMFTFELSTDTVSCSKLLEFRVTALDVTHGFGIYDSTGTLLGQVQAMPGYVNRLRIRLDTPGRYNIFCLEYCGPLHQEMRHSLFVR